MIKLNVNGYEFHPSVHVFHGGEVNVDILKDNKQLRKFAGPNCFKITANIRNSQDVMELLFVKDAIDVWLLSKSIFDAKFILEIPYLPYARQDRVCNKGESFSLKVFANLINNMNFDKVKVYDAHSIVATSLINNCESVYQEDIISLNEELSNKLRSGKIGFLGQPKVSNYVIVSPDAGAEKKALQVAQYFGCDMIRATKRRDIATGKILEIGFIDPIPENRSFLIVDDICDGGGTFLPLAGELALADANHVELYVTHGIFSKGTQILEGAFETVYTTDSFYKGESDNIQVIKL